MQHIDVVNAYNEIERVPYFASTDEMDVSENIWQLDQRQQTTKTDTHAARRTPRVVR